MLQRSRLRAGDDPCASTELMPNACSNLGSHSEFKSFAHAGRPFRRDQTSPKAELQKVVGLGILIKSYPLVDGKIYPQGDATLPGPTQLTPLLGVSTACPPTDPSPSPTVTCPDACHGLSRPLTPTSGSSSVDLDLCDGRSVPTDYAVPKDRPVRGLLVPTVSIAGKTGWTV